MFYDWALRGLKGGVVTTAYPYRAERVENYRGEPEIGPGSCPEGCQECRNVCLTGAVDLYPPVIDTGRCIFCGRCAEVCRAGRITFSNRFAMAAASRPGLLTGSAGPAAVTRPERLIFGRSLHIRHVDAGGCGACERETASLNNPFYDASRLGIFFTTSPRHADVLLVTGPVTRGMLDPLRKAFAAMPGPKFVVAAGGCAAGGGPFGQPATAGGVDAVLPVDVYIPGCPPHPLALLDGLGMVGGRGGRRKEGRKS